MKELSFPVLVGKGKRKLIVEYAIAHLCQGHKSITRRRLIDNNLDRRFLAQWDGGHVRGAVSTEMKLD